MDLYLIDLFGLRGKREWRLVTKEVYDWVVNPETPGRGMEEYDWLDTPPKSVGVEPIQVNIAHFQNDRALAAPSIYSGDSSASLVECCIKHNVKVMKTFEGLIY